MGVVITSPPSTSATNSDRCRAAVAELTDTANGDWTNSAKRRSSFAVFGPCPHQPERMTSATASISLSS